VSNWFGYVIHHEPGPMLAVPPTVELAKRFSQQRVDPLIAESPALPSQPEQRRHPRGSRRPFLIRDVARAFQSM